MLGVKSSGVAKDTNEFQRKVLQKAEFKSREISGVAEGRKQKEIWRTGAAAGRDEV